ncbi:MAG: hypothetical protein HY308_15160 [Gammaproteobacteria bacterium]|nr:hypothetical protein [Gammaproteobacteria bacterium]
MLLQLSWQPNTDVIAGYRVYSGPTVAGATTQESDLTVTGNPNFNSRAPLVTYYAARDLNLKTGDTVCFRLRAYNAANVLSAYSQATCGTI